MKKFILVLVFLLTACGSQVRESQPDIINDPVVWQGYADQDPDLLQKFNEAASCLESFGIAHRAGFPYVVALSFPFPYGSGTAAGCVYIDTIYYVPTLIDYPYDLFKHEAIHWMTGLDNSTHDLPFFVQCQG